MNIQGDGYSVQYHAADASLQMQGIMRLKGEEYAPLVALLEHILLAAPAVIHLDLRRLDALNSSGITTLAKFIAQVNRLNNSRLVVLASPNSAWQKKSLHNFQRLMPNLQTNYQPEQKMEVRGMEVRGEEFSLTYVTDTGVIHCQGIVRLQGDEYRSIAALLEQVATQPPARLMLDLRELQALNSSGITTLARFVAKLNQQANYALTVQGNPQIAWQKKSIKNFQRLMPTIEFDWST